MAASVFWRGARACLPSWTGVVGVASSATDKSTSRVARGGRIDVARAPLYQKRAQPGSCRAPLQLVPRDLSQRAASECAATSGDVLPHINTANTARDVDAIRAALGESKLSYMGFSYGTYLGAVYTQLFPQRTDRFILDSNIHPRRIWRPTVQSWAYAVEVAYHGFSRWAAERDDVYGLGDTPAEVYELTIETARALDAEPCTLPSGALLTGQVFRETIRNYLLRPGDPIFPTFPTSSAKVPPSVGCRLERQSARAASGRNQRRSVATLTTMRAPSSSL